MLGHEAIGLIRKERGKGAALQDRLAMLEEVLASERAAQRQERERFDAILAELHTQLAAQSELEWENQELVRENEQLRSQQADMLDGTFLQKNQEQVLALQEKNKRLQDEGRKVAVELGAYRQLATKVAARSAEQEQRYLVELDALRTQQAELVAELAAAEQQLRLYTAQEAACASCEQCGTSACPGVNLCGKTVL